MKKQGDYVITTSDDFASTYGFYVDTGLVQMQKKNWYRAIEWFARAMHEKQGNYKVSKREVKQLIFDCLNSV